MSFLQAVLLGVLQGLTEFLPVSSSGHLAVLYRIFRMPAAATMTVVAIMHLGTAAALFVYFRRRLAGIFVGFRENVQARKMVWYVFLASLPAGLVGLLLESRVESAFSSSLLVGLMLLVTGLVVFLTVFAKTRGRQLDWHTALVIGLAQMAAILPGISRSGMTVAAALFLGLRREDAFEFSFLLSLPIVVAAAAKEAVGADWNCLGLSTSILGGAAAFFSGLVALALLRRAVVNRRFFWFAFYCWAVGLLVILFFSRS